VLGLVLNRRNLGAPWTSTKGSWTRLLERDWVEGAVALSMASRGDFMSVKRRERGALDRSGRGRF
jgi:hypothetical protein